MRLSAIHKWLLVLGLLAGQGLALAHDVLHPALDLQSHLCQICAHGQPDAAGAAPTLPSVVIVGAFEPAPVPVAVLPRRCHQRHYAIRAPPVLSS